METETKHTPGPWYKAAAVTKGIDNYIEIAIFSDVQVHPYRTVAKIISPLESIALANAELIARAPELLEQLKQLKEERKELVEALREVSDQSTVYRSFSKETETKIKSLLSKVKQ